MKENFNYTDDMESKNELSVAYIYTHLFPRNNLTDLPEGGVSARLSRLWKMYINEQKFREARFLVAVARSSSFAERINLSQPTQYLMNHILRSLNISNISALELTNDHELDDLIDTKKEKFGGVTFKKVEISLTADLILGNKKYADEPLYYIGILNSKNIPVGIMFFHTGDKPRKMKRKVLSLNNPSFSPI